MLDNENGQAAGKVIVCPFLYFDRIEKILQPIVVIGAFRVKNIFENYFEKVLTKINFSSIILFASV